MIVTRSQNQLRGLSHSAVIVVRPQNHLASHSDSSVAGMKHAPSMLAAFADRNLEHQGVHPETARSFSFPTSLVVRSNVELGQCFFFQVWTAHSITKAGRRAPTLPKPSTGAPCDLRRALLQRRGRSGGSAAALYPPMCHLSRELRTQTVLLIGSIFCRGPFPCRQPVGGGEQTEKTQQAGASRARRGRRS